MSVTMDAPTSQTFLQIDTISTQPYATQDVSFPSPNVTFTGMPTQAPIVSPSTVGKTQFNTKSTLQSTSPLPSPFVCDYPGCGKAFRLKGNLKRHQNIHSGEKRFSCTYCGRTFLRKADMQVHLRVHTKEKPYSCKYSNCDKRFARRSDLLSHERTHSGDKPFPCQFPGCTRRFARKFDLGKHYRTHENNNLVLSKHMKIKRSGSTTSTSTLAEEEESTEDDSLKQVLRFESKSWTMKTEPNYATEQTNFQQELKNLPDSFLKLQANILETNQDDLVLNIPTCGVSTVNLHDYSAHNPSCGHLSLKHGDHHDYVVNKHLVCRDSVKCINPFASMGNLATTNQLTQGTSNTLGTTVIDAKSDSVGDLGNKWCDNVQSINRYNFNTDSNLDAILPTMYSDHETYYREAAMSKCNHPPAMNINAFPPSVFNFQSTAQSQDQLQSPLDAIQTSQNQITQQQGTQDQVVLSSFQNAHGPGCGHLPVRHFDHIDYVVDDSLFCQHAGAVVQTSVDRNEEPLELLDQEFWDFYGAVGSLQ